MSKQIMLSDLPLDVSSQISHLACDVYAVHVREILPGDTILHNGELKTVGHDNIKHDDFMGNTLFGDSYRSGNLHVLKIVVKRALPNLNI